MAMRCPCTHEFTGALVACTRLYKVKPALLVNSSVGSPTWTQWVIKYMITIKSKYFHLKKKKKEESSYKPETRSRVPPSQLVCSWSILAPPPSLVTHPSCLPHPQHMAELSPHSPLPASVRPTHACTQLTMRLC